MLRIITLCMVLLLSVGIILPFGNSAHGIRQSAQMGKRLIRRQHSRAWWRRYRARMRRKRAEALAHRNAQLALPKNISLGELIPGTVLVPSEVPGPGNVSASVTTPVPVTGPAPEPMTTSKPVSNATSMSELKPKTKNSVKPLPGQMNLSVVAMSRPNPAFLTSREEARMLAGVNVADLRRIVIDKMVVAGGWVTNDFVREVSGGRVFVVTARTPQDGRAPEKAWTFYFTEVGGRIYGLTTDSAVEYTDRMTSEAERLITSLRSNPQATKR